jgi:DNA repair protein RecO (recombination protein O)
VNAMESKKSEAIILRTRDFGESDLIVTAFSNHYGNIKGIAKGARRSSKRFVNSLNIFSLVNLTFKERSNRELVWVDSCDLVDGYPGIRSNYTVFSNASYIVEITEILFPANIQNIELFNLLKFALGALSDKQDPEKIRIIFQAQAMRSGGFGINLSTCSVCGRSYKGKGRALFDPSAGSLTCMSCGKETSLMPGLNPDSVNFLEIIQSPEISLTDKLNLKADALVELKEALRLHVEHHLGRRLKSSRYI